MIKRLSLTLIALLTFTLTLSGTSLWTPIAEKLRASTVYIEMTVEGNKGGCSGFVIDQAKKQILTAAHCDGDTPPTADGTQTIKLFKDERKDLMVLRAYNVDKPALSLASAVPEEGDEVASFGFGFALEKGMFRLGHVSIKSLDIEGLSGPFVVFDATFIPGQSGGPVVNSKGEVVSIVQRAGEGFGLGVGPDVIKDRVGRYFSAK